MSGMALTMTNMGALLFKQEQFEEAIPLLLQSYQIFKQIGSPNQEHPLNYLTAIGEKIGEERFEEIVKGLKDK